MQVVVLNGANLDVLARRNPELYGGLSLSELETRIYEWASDLGCHVRCRQTNHEGEYVDWCHDALGWADGVVVNPGAWTHYSYAIRDALELFEEPILVTNSTNVLYLAGFKSSNAALLVEDDRVRLFTDFRYAEAARTVEGVEFEETKRALLKDLAGRLSGRIGFEQDSISYAGY